MWAKKGSITERVIANFDDNVSKSYAYRVSSYLESQASQIHSWYFDVLTTAIWTCNSYYGKSDHRCPMCGWPVKVQIVALSDVMDDDLTYQAENGVDPFTYIHKMSQDEFIRHYTFGSDLAHRLDEAEIEVQEAERMRLKRIDDLAEENESELRRWGGGVSY